MEEKGEGKKRIELYYISTELIESLMHWFMDQILSYVSNPVRGKDAQPKLKLSSTPKTVVSTRNTVLSTNPRKRKSLKG